MSLPNYMGCLMQFYKSLSLYYTEMCFKILNFFQRKSVFLPRNLLYLKIDNEKKMFSTGTKKSVFLTFLQLCPKLKKNIYIATWWACTRSCTEEKAFLKSNGHNELTKFVHFLCYNCQYSIFFFKIVLSLQWRQVSRILSIRH
jgi:hypothetical protein